MAAARRLAAAQRMEIKISYLHMTEKERING